MFVARSNSPFNVGERGHQISRIRNTIIVSNAAYDLYSLPAPVTVILCQSGIDHTGEFQWGNELERRNTAPYGSEWSLVLRCIGLNFGVGNYFCPAHKWLCAEQLVATRSSNDVLHMFATDFKTHCGGRGGRGDEDGR
jgi:hypothetical protein